VSSGDLLPDFGREEGSRKRDTEIYRRPVRMLLLPAVCSDRTRPEPDGHRIKAVPEELIAVYKIESLFQ
jgi:hypothetical protein